MRRSDTRPAHSPQRRSAEPPFERAVCGLDGSPASLDAARQATALAGRVHFLCVRSEEGAGMTRATTIREERARTAIDAALSIAAAAQVPAEAEVLVGEHPWVVLRSRAEPGDLLAVASHGRTRFGGIMLGGTASSLVHAATEPVLVARSTEDARFPDRVLIATDGSEPAAAAVVAGARIAAAAGSELAVVTVDHGSDAQLAAIHGARAAELAGREAAMLNRSGRPSARVVAEAEAWEASLLVIGSRGLGGVRALGSVSERVAHAARCSVLVVHA